MFSTGFALGLGMGYIASLITIRYLDKVHPDLRPPVDGRAPFVKRKQEKRKPIVVDEHKEWLKELERLKDQGR